MMKKLCLLLTLDFQLLTLNCFAQWVQQQSGTSNPLYDVEFINRNTGWACGYATILKTTNSGTNWFPQNSGAPDKILTGIHPVDENIVYCVGWFETILKSTNGGNTWQAIRNGTWGQGSSFEEVYFINQNTGWMLKTGPNGGYILKTTDGGASFDSAHVIYTYMHDIYFKDSMNGVLCGNGDLIMKSTNGGVSWYEVFVPVGNELPDFYKISFVGNTGWVVGRGSNSPLGKKVFRTTDFGSTWDTIARVPSPSSSEIYSVFFSSSSTGWCGGNYGYDFKTTNGGYNWLQQQTPVTGFRASIYMYSDSVGWMVGGGGYILYTNTSGQYVSITPIGAELPEQFELYQNYPNPFNTSTKFKVQSPKLSNVAVIVYNVLGKEIAVIVNQLLSPGVYEISFDASELPSGIYFYKMIADGVLIGTKKLILIK